MKRTAIILTIFTALAAFGTEPRRTLNEVTVSGRRPMADIGVQKTQFDSLALKENVSLSMADVLTFNSSVFIKSYGRATLSTVAFRGTSPSHTQVSWNGLNINNPMLGMTDFSTIPAFFIDSASLLHGTSSVNESGGGLGGAVRLGSGADVAPGIGLQYVQGIGSFKTFDEFLRLTYGGKKWSSTTRVSYSSSPNDYKYVNHDKKVNIYDSEGNVIDRRHPTERNRSGAYKDFNAMQQVSFNNGHGDRIDLSAWFMNSNRELPMTTTDYGDERDFENRQRERTLRAVAAWRHSRSSWTSDLRAGYTHTRLAYDYRREVSSGNWSTMTRSRSRINTFFASARGDWMPTSKWLLTASLSAYQHLVRSADKNIILQNGDRAIIGYDKGRIELSGAVSAKWQPIERLGLSAVMREEMFGRTFAPLIPAFFIDGLLSRRGNVMVRASVSRNHKFPSLNDLYFLPGGNPDLRSEHGWTYDVGASFNLAGSAPFGWTLGGSATWFDSRIDDWILWLPTLKGFFSPRNVKTVHAYGIEARLNAAAEFARGWLAEINANFSWTPSVNVGEPMSDADRSVGRQLPYVPRRSASLTARLSWRSWSLLWKWVHYSERYTMSSNDLSLTGRLPDYFMNNISLEKTLQFRPIDIQLKLAVNNLFNEEYLSVLSRPMPGINFMFSISLTPKL